MPRTITRAELCESIHKNVGLSRNDSADLLEMVLNEIALSLESGKSVKIASFGSFSVRQKRERLGRNPKTGQEIPITPRRVLIFRPSQMLKANVRGDNPSEDKESYEIDMTDPLVIPE